MIYSNYNFILKATFSLRLTTLHFKNLDICTQQNFYILLYYYLKENKNTSKLSFGKLFKNKINFYKNSHEKIKFL